MSETAGAAARSEGPNRPRSGRHRRGEALVALVSLAAVFLAGAAAIRLLRDPVVGPGAEERSNAKDEPRAGAPR